MNFFSIFLGFYVTGRVGTPRNDFFFFFPFLGPSQLILAWKEAMMVLSKFINFFCNFFGIFYSRSGRNPSERFLFLFSLFLGLSLPIFTWKEAMMVFSNFLNFSTIFLKFSIPCQVGTNRNEFFYFLFFSAFPNLFWLGKKLWWCFLIFWIFLLFFLKFSIQGRVETHRNNFFFFSHSRPFPTYSSSERSYDGVF